MDIEEVRSPWPHRGFIIVRIGVGLMWGSQVRDGDLKSRGVYGSHTEAMKAIDDHLDRELPFKEDKT